VNDHDDSNPAFTLFVNDVLCWEPVHWLTDSELGQVFKLIVYGAKLGGHFPKNHPLLQTLDAKVVALCCNVDEDDCLAVVRPVDLPKLMAARREFLEKCRDSGAKGGKAAAERRRRGRLHAV